MKAMRLHAPGQPLVLDELPVPQPASGELLLRVAACGVCRTDQHVVAGELPGTRCPLTPGHEIVGRVVSAGAGFAAGDRVGVPWLGAACGRCRWCREGRENLCEQAPFTGYTRDGGCAEYVVANASFRFAIPARYDDAEAAPLLCAGLIGYRAWRAAGDADAQRFATESGAAWAGGSDESPPEPLDAAILFAPVGALVPAAAISGLPPCS